ncbi:PIN domain-containing protein [Candidatus Woesearchaeota archaeon]|nr:PIN domain-containing protein [Candidatus Woesearchaeota archaeon]
MGFIIDTSVLIEIENNNLEVINKIEQLKNAPKSELYITIFTFCEFYYGAINKSEENRERILERLQEYTILNTTLQTGIIFCDLLNQSKKKGKPTSHFDLFIAAMALEQGFTLLTMDRSFAEVSGLKKVLF